MTDADTARRPGRTRTGDTEPVRTLERGLTVLRMLGQHGALTLGDAARHAGLNASTAYRLLHTLQAQGFAQESAGLWQVGVQAFATGQAYLGAGGLIPAARPEMQALVAELGETVNLAVLQAPDVVYVHQEEGRGLMRMFTQIGARVPLHCTGAGKALLAWQPTEEVRRALGERSFQSFTPHTLTTPAAYLAELEGVRRAGYALDNEERELGVRCVAVPVLDSGGQTVAALSLSAPSSRLPDSRVPELAARLQRASRSISKSGTTRDASL
ncbi:IclR family transcriptional regulator [Deinococcus sp. QL22]|uniref:IclR family transcriptional regulator n=1 Tax=Deinococcus sp. QL22 TaxID=2939437 RepID=UPI002016C7FE|nr:IclR family transcriptional regulator [Deinococcus sp. QL22]UQN05561.1 IclR family transcriptional regulator [Deinococcus sp. QL22]